MATDVAFTRTRTGSNAITHTCTLEVADVDSAILKVDPTSEITIMIDFGGGSFEVGGTVKAHDDTIVEADLLTLNSASITADYHETLTKGVTALQIQGTAATASTVIRILEVKRMMK